MVLLYTDLGCQGLHILCSIMLLDAICAEDAKQILPKAILSMLGTLFTLRVLSPWRQGECTVRKCAYMASKFISYIHPCLEGLK